MLQTQVYSFAGLLFTYLFATWCGSALYRRHLARGRAWSHSRLLALLSLAAAAQLLQSDPRAALPQKWMQIGWVLLGIVPYCGILGYLTPKLIDEYSQGEPGAAGRAYAINVVGCVVGPLAASYVLLPLVGVHWSGVLLAAPLWLIAAVALCTARPARAAAEGGKFRGGVLTWGIATVCLALAAMVGTSYEDLFARQGAKVLRDHTATVIALRKADGGSDLLVNGKSITSLTPTTKLMAHLPLAQVSGEPESALVICFGMGTTYRSLLSWDIRTTAVELVPSVGAAFDFYFSDAEEQRRNPLGRIVIDDGRRFLSRTTERFDVITLDPPPPPEAAASSLLYSREFYRLVKPRLSEQGILHQWYPGGDLATFRALLRSIMEEFPHVRVLRAFDGWGYHILASLQPIPQRSAAELAARLPAAARQDLLEWSTSDTAESLFAAVIGSEIEAAGVLVDDPRVIITDDRPYNEYCLLRRGWEHWTGTYTIVL